MIQWIAQRKKAISILIAAGLIAAGVANPQTAISIASAAVSLVADEAPEAAPGGQ